MALTADTARNLVPAGPDSVNDLPVLTNTLIYQGSIVGSSAGYARGCVAGDKFMGINQHGQANNNPGASGAILVRVVTKGVWRGMAITGASGVADFGKNVYASADDTLTLTPGSNTFIGRICRYDPDTTKFDVAFEAESHRGGT